MGESDLGAIGRGRLLLLGAFAAAYLLPLGVRPLFIPDEYRYAEIPREMRAGGDWIAPRLAGFRYFEKPPLAYWVGAAALAAFGENAFAARLPSALAAGLCALLVSSLVRRSGEGEGAAPLAAGILLGSGMFFGVGTYKTIDQLFTLCLTCSLVCAQLACGEPRRRLLWWALAGAAAGAAFLTKGFLGFALPALVLAPFLTWERRWRIAMHHAWIAPATALAVALPWSLAVALRDSDFWSYFIWTEHVRRFASKTAQHREPFWFFAPVLLGGAMPWVLLWPAAASGLRAHLRAPLVRLALCWLVFPFALFSVSRGKLAVYILPCLPALAILCALGLRADLAGSGRRTRAGLGALAALSGTAALVAAVSQLALGRLPLVYGEGEAERVGLASLAALASCGAFAAAAASRRPRWTLMLATLAPIPLYCAWPFVVPDRMLERKAPGALLARHGDRLSGDALLVSQAGLAPAVCWHSRRTDVFVMGRPGELDYGARRPDSQGRLLTAEQLGARLAALAPGRVAVVVARRESHDEWAPRLPAPSLEDAVGDFVYSEYAGGPGIR